MLTWIQRQIRMDVPPDTCSILCQVYARIGLRIYWWSWDHLRPAITRRRLFSPDDGAHKRPIYVAGKWRRLLGAPKYSLLPPPCSMHHCNRQYRELNRKHTDVDIVPVERDKLTPTDNGKENKNGGKKSRTVKHLRLQSFPGFIYLVVAKHINTGRIRFWRRIPISSGIYRKISHIAAWEDADFNVGRRWRCEGLTPRTTISTFLATSKCSAAAGGRWFRYVSIFGKEDISGQKSSALLWPSLYKAASAVKECENSCVHAHLLSSNHVTLKANTVSINEQLWGQFGEPVPVWSSEDTNCCTRVAGSVVDFIVIKRFIVRYQTRFQAGTWLGRRAKMLIRWCTERR